MTDNTPYVPTTATVREAFSEMSSWDMSADEADAAFDRWLATVRAEVLAEQGTDWEYAISPGHGSVNFVGSKQYVERSIASFEKAGAPLRDGEMVVRRRKAGTWEPAPITESEEA